MPKQKAPQKSANGAAAPWQYTLMVEEIAATGQRVELVADDTARAAIAQIAGLRDLPRLEAQFDLRRRGEAGVHVTGLVSATVGQTCVVTLDPLVNEIEERLDLVFMPPEPGADAAANDDEGDSKPRDAKLNDPEPLVGGVVDLGALATEFLILGLDPYPRKPGASFEAPAEPKPEESPFAALAKLKG
jgi:uncharacterized metal-binding protein YceD (DUF177 family)